MQRWHPLSCRRAGDDCMGGGGGRALGSMVWLGQRLMPAMWYLLHHAGSDAAALIDRWACFRPSPCIARALPAGRGPPSPANPEDYRPAPVSAHGSSVWGYYLDGQCLWGLADGVFHLTWVGAIRCVRLWSRLPGHSGDGRGRLGSKAV